MTVSKINNIADPSTPKSVRVAAKLTGEDYRVTRSILLCGLSWLALTSSAHAAEAQPPAGADAITSVPEVVVTAQKRKENLQDVPIAVTALSGQALATQGIATVNDLNIVTPGLTVYTGTGFVLPHIRGVGTTAIGPGLENPVATYVDGVYYASGPGSLIALSDVLQVEVLKGPQGTLFGRNATGGLIQVNTLDPTHAATGHITVDYANYDTVTTDAYLSGGLTDWLTTSFGVRYSSQGEGYGRNLATGQYVYQTKEDLAARSKWVLTPTSDTTIHVSFDYMQRSGNGNTSNHEAPGTVPTFGAPWVGSPWNTDSNVQPKDYLTGGGASVRLDQKLGWAQFASTTAYRQTSYATLFDGDFTPVPALGLSTDITDLEFTQEFQLLSNSSSRIQWALGLYYYQDHGEYSPSDLLFGGPLINPLAPIQTIQIAGGQKTQSYSGYAQVTAPIAPRTNLTVGLRYTTETRTLDAAESGYLVGGVPIGDLFPPIHASKSYSDPTWRISLDHKLQGGALLYVSYNRGFKSGGFDAGAPQDPAFKPEILDAYEAGVKSEYFGGRLRVNAAAFYYDYSNLQVAVFTNDQPGLATGGGAVIYGTDWDLVAKVTPSLTLTAGLSLLHDRFTSSPDALFFIQQPTGGAIPVTESANGHRLPITPDATFNLNADYQRETPIGTWNLDAGYYSNSGWYAQVDNFLKQNSYDLLSASVTWSSPDKRYSVRLWGKNLTDAAVFSALSASNLNSIAQYQPPRTFGVTVGVGF